MRRVIRLGVFGLSVEPASGDCMWWRADLWFWEHGVDSASHRIGTYLQDEAETQAIKDASQFIGPRQWMARGEWEDA